jgi:Holliday junction resolvase RusA-like endonuclease
MNNLHEVEIRLKYTIKAKKRPGVNFRTRSINNPSENDEYVISHDVKLQLTKSKIKEIYDSKYVAIEIINYYKTSKSSLVGKPKQTAPDVDNFTKLFCDSMNKIL